jgi:hypothetical protein
VKTPKGRSDDIKPEFGSSRKLKVVIIISRYKRETALLCAADVVGNHAGSCVKGLVAKPPLPSSNRTMIIRIVVVFDKGNEVRPSALEVVSMAAKETDGVFSSPSSAPPPPPVLFSLSGVSVVPTPAL